MTTTTQMRKMVKMTKNEIGFHKVEEHIFENDNDFEAASLLADSLFAPFKQGNTAGRDGQEARVRIRRRPTGGFRVILYRHANQLEKKQEVTVEDGTAPVTKKNRRHHNDRKGRRRDQIDQPTTEHSGVDGVPGHSSEPS